MCCFSSNYKGVRSKTGWFRIRIMCLSGAKVVNQHGQSHISGGAKSGATRSDITGSDHDRNDVTGSDHMRMCNRFPRFFLIIVVVQNVSLRMTDMATGSDVTKSHVTPKGFPCKSERITNRKLRNIRPNGTF